MMITAKYITEPLGNYAAGPGRKLGNKTVNTTHNETWEQDGEYYTQRLDFYENRTGTDIIRIEHRNGYVTEDRYNFEWRWDNSAQTCIRMVYGPSDISYFENIWLAGNFLKGTLDGVNVNFTGIR